MKKLSIVLLHVVLLSSVFLTFQSSIAQTPLDTVKSVHPDDRMIVNPGKGNDAMAVKPGDVHDGMSVLSDTAFLRKNIKDNKMELQLCRLGRDKGKSAAVKKVASMMLTDHTAILQDLVRIAARARLPFESNVPDVKTHSNVSDDASFDENWAGQMLAMHEAKIAELETFIGLTKNATLRVVVLKAIPKLKQHREMLLKIPGAKEKSKALHTV